MLVPVRYVGLKPWLKGHTGLGYWKAGYFVVQLDDLRHPWAYAWHVTNPKHWKEIT